MRVLGYRAFRASGHPDATLRSWIMGTPWAVGESLSVCAVVTEGERNEYAAWYYPHPPPLAQRIRVTSHSGGKSTSWSTVRFVNDDHNPLLRWMPPLDRGASES